MALTSFKEQFGLIHRTTNELSNLSSNIVITFQAGCFLACFLSLPCAETFGRRTTLFIASLVFFVGASIMLTGNITALYIGRVLTGLGVGPITVVAPLYISEISPAPLRGRFIGLFDILVQTGGLLGFWINYGVSLGLSSSTQWRVPVSIQLPLISILALGCLFLPETPRFLVKKDRSEQALATLARIRNLSPDHEFVQAEYSDIYREIQIERVLVGLDPSLSRRAKVQRQLSECLRPNIAYRISIGVMTQFIGQLSGINGINYYSPIVFKSLGVVGTSTSLFATGIYGVVKTVTGIITYFLLIDRLGRRTMLLSGAIIMVFSLYFIGAYIKIAKPNADNEQISAGGIAAVAFIYIFVIGYISSFGGIPWILSSEAVPLNVRAISATLGAATQWAMNLAITKAMPYMISHLGYGTFFFFGTCIFFGGIYVWFFVPETRGLALEHMAIAFNQDDVVGKYKRWGENGSIKEEGRQSAQELENV